MPQFPKKYTILNIVMKLPTHLLNSLTLRASASMRQKKVFKYKKNAINTNTCQTYSRKSIDILLAGS